MTYQHALAQAEAGNRVVPIVEGKPAAEATRDPAVIQNYWARFPDAEVGLDLAGLQAIIANNLDALRATLAHGVVPKGYPVFEGGGGRAMLIFTPPAGTKPITGRAAGIAACPARGIAPAPERVLSFITTPAPFLQGCARPVARR
jgi:hypothetical protein